MQEAGTGSDTTMREPAEEGWNDHTAQLHPGPAIPAASLPRLVRSTPEAVAKRALDLALSAVLLTVLSPLLAGVAALVRLDSPGPALFRQRRTGQGGTVFRMVKFRTMHVHLADETCRAQTTRYDPRVTRVGRFLRRCSLDELPQLFNVLAGDMSLVGPRPHALGTRVCGRPLAELEPHYYQRYRVKPGITGLAQTGGCRGELDTPEKLRRRVALDLDYIDRWSIGLDLAILVRTAFGTAFSGDAY